MERLKEDVRENFELIKRLGLRVRTVYIGGGTPTILTEEQLRDLLSHIASLTDVNALDEYTMEAGRPDTITKEKLDVAKELGVTRISVNPQTMDDRVLALMGRNHTAADIIRMVRTLILKLGHTRQFTKHGVAVEHPCQLCMSGHMRLYK